MKRASELTALMLAALSAVETVAGASTAVVVLGELLSVWDWL